MACGCCSAIPKHQDPRLLFGVPRHYHFDSANGGDGEGESADREGGPLDAYVVRLGSREIGSYERIRQDIDRRNQALPHETQGAVRQPKVRARGDVLAARLEFCRGIWESEQGVDTVARLDVFSCPSLGILVRQAQLLSTHDGVRSHGYLSVPPISACANTPTM